MKPTSLFVKCVVVIALSMAAFAQQTGGPLSASEQTAATSRSVFPGTVTGSGTANYIPEWTGTSTLGNSVLFQTGGKIGVGTTSPSVALDVDGRINVSKSYRIDYSDVLVASSQSVGVGFGALFSQGSGTFYSTAVGQNALQLNTTGSYDTAVGNDALFSNTTGEGNTALGSLALFRSTTSYFNTAVGSVALSDNTTGAANTAVGYVAMDGNTTGTNNVSIGISSLQDNQTGSSNIAIGAYSGFNIANSNNIDIGSYGTAADNGVIRIGIDGTHTSFFASGIRGVTTGMNDGVPVVIDSNGQLGTVSSSRRFKEDIQEMGDASRGLMSLRPVTFRYRKAFNDGSKPIEYGLIAEDVEKVYPDLVVHSADGQVETVKYQVLDSMLLNEVQRQQKEISSLQQRLAKMEAAMASVERRDK